MTATPLHLMHFEGGDALAPFRAQALLARLQAACPRVTDVAARHVHWAAFEVHQMERRGSHASRGGKGDNPRF